ncbi:hypothetical protein KM043_011837 [Ampulex compressa]|nr:hypothetical protein KM043_011837 [Ampulex compressa]
MLVPKVIRSSLNDMENLLVLRPKPLRCLQVRRINVRQVPTMPGCQYTPSAYENPSYEKVKDFRLSSVSPTMKTFYKRPLLIHQGKGQWLWDHNGRRYLDMFAGIATVSVGHCHPRVAAAIAEQAHRLGHISSIYMHPALHQYVEKLTAKLPEKLNVVYLTNSGSEANELAFLMAKVYTQKHNIISLRNGYHGGTYTVLASTALSTWKYPIVQPPGHIHTMNPDVYKGPWGGSKCRDSPVQVVGRECGCKDGECMASEKYFQQLQDIVRYTIPHTDIAAFIAESIQGIGGTVQYPKTFLKKAQDFIQEKGGLFIADEVQTGFGRTGEHFWGFESHDLQPDIVTMAKGIANGFPMGAVVTTTEISRVMAQAMHFNTFGGNALGCAAASAVIDVIEEEGLQRNADIIGTHLLRRLSSLTTDFSDIVGDVRGKGLMIGIELVSDVKSKQHIRPEHMAQIFEDIKDMGVLLGRGGLHSNVLRIKPPMCITKEDADFTFETITIALEKHRERYLKDKNSVFYGKT